MNDDQLHTLYTFLSDKFAAINARFDENNLKQDEILNMIAKDNESRDMTIVNHEKRIIKLEKYTA